MQFKCSIRKNIIYFLRILYPMERMEAREFDKYCQHCTRAQKRLVVVAYTENVNSVKETALSNGWFAESKIYTL